MDAHRAHPNYLMIWVWLAALMLLSVLAAYLPTSAVLVLAIILGLALVKAVLVALYYMHLRFESPLVWLVVIPPLVLAAILVVALLPDSAAARRTAPPVTGESPHASSPAHP